MAPERDEPGHREPEGRQPEGRQPEGRQPEGPEPGDERPLDRLDDRPLRQPAASRLAPDHPGRQAVLDAHARALASGEPGYTDPGTGLFVLTAAFLAARGHCCGRGCRHCPYVRDAGGPE